MPPRFLIAGFVLVAAGLAGLEWMRPVQDSAPKTILVSDSQRNFIRQQIAQSNVSYEQALQTWIEEEALYQEGMQLGLDKGDLIVKRRVVQKMRFLLEGMTPLPEPTNEQLQAWLDQHPKRFQTGQGIQFEHLFFSRGKRGDQALFDARAVLSRLKSGSVVEPSMSDPFPLNASKSPLPIEQITRDLGGEMGKKLLTAPLQAWSEPMNSALGVHVVKVLQHTPGRTMSLQEAGALLKGDLMAAQRDTLNKASTAALLNTYTVEHQP